MFQDMRERDPVTTFSYLIRSLKERHPDLAYIHVIEPTPQSTDDAANPPSNDFARAIWQPGVFLSADGHTRESAFKAAKERGDVVVFGKWFISNVSASETLCCGCDADSAFIRSLIFPGASRKASSSHPSMKARSTRRRAR